MKKPWTSTDIDKAVELRRKGVCWAEVARLVAAGRRRKPGQSEWKRAKRLVMLQCGGIDPMTGTADGSDAGPALPSDNDLDQFLRRGNIRTADLSKGRPAWMSHAAYRMERSRRRMERAGGIADPVDAHLQRGGRRPAILCD